MTSEYEYFESIELKKVEALMEQELLTREEYELVNQWFPAFASEYLFHNFWDDTFLNLNVYSEVEHHQRQYEMELGF